MEERWSEQDNLSIDVTNVYRESHRRTFSGKLFQSDGPITICKTIFKLDLGLVNISIPSDDIMIKHIPVDILHIWGTK